MSLLIHRDLLGRETHRRHYEDATTRYAQKLDQVHRHEITEDHAEDRGEKPREIPVDLEHGDDFHGQFFLGEVLEYNEMRHDTTPVTPVTYSINRMETQGTLRCIR